MARGKQIAEKPNNFFRSMKRLIKNLRVWRVLLILAIVLASFSSIFALIAPDKLSDLTDEISAGLIPKKDNFIIITDAIKNNFDEEKINHIIFSEEISYNDKKILFDIDENMTDQEKSEYFLKLPDNILKIILDDIEVNNIKISVADQIKFIHLMGNMNSNNDFSKLDDLPKSVYEIVKPTINMQKIKKTAIFIGIIYLLSALFGYIQNLSMTLVSNKFAKRLRSLVSSKINTLPLKYFDNKETGDILSIVTNDIDTINQNLNNSIASLVSSITLFIGSIIMMFYTNWIMALTAIISSLIGFIFMGGILKKSQKYFAESQKALGDLNGYIEQMYSSHNIVKAYNGVNKSIEEFSNFNQNLYEAKRKSIFMSGTMQPLMGFIGNLGYVAVCIVGALLTMNNIITFGVIVAFIVYVRLFTNPLSQIAQAMTNLQSTAAASERVFAFLDEKEMNKEDDINGSLNKKNVKGQIEFKNVKFGYDKDKTVIKDFSVLVNPCEKIAIVGPTGAGKTTLVNLLMKFYEIDDGDIIIDNISISNLTRENIHDLFVMVLQDTWLFEGSIRDNIKFNKNDVTDKEIWDALKTVGVDYFVKTLPGGLDAKLSESDSISQGQKQLLTIARGMIKDAPFLILDEATSNVDTRTEEKVQMAMDKLMEKKTTFIIAHRLSTIKNADLILVMNEGNIIEQGTHDSLMKLNGFYADLYNSQFKKMF